MRHAGWSQTGKKQREPVTATGIKKGCRIIVSLTNDNVENIDARWGADVLDLTTDSTEFRRAYVDRIDENAGVLYFTACRADPPYARTGTKGVVQLHEEGTTWVGGWTEDNLAALRATYNLSDNE